MALAKGVSERNGAACQIFDLRCNKAINKGIGLL